MPPLTDNLYPFLTILAGIENSINLTSVNPPMRYLLNHNDKIAISNTTIFYLDPYELRTFDDAFKYCQSLNFTMALPKSESHYDLINKLITKWNYRVSSPKFNSVNAWIRAHINDTARGYSCDNHRYSYWRNNICSGKTFIIDKGGEKSLVPVPFEWWRYRQPDNTANMEYNVVMTGEPDGGYYGSWNDVAGTSLQHTICEYNIPNAPANPLKDLENRLYPTPYDKTPDNWSAKSLLFELETSNRTVLIVYESLPYHQVVEFCQCMNMDLAAPRSMEEAQEIDRRGELKFDYFTNYIRISDQKWLDGRSLMVVDSDQLPWKGGLGPAFSGTQYWSKWKWSGLESITMSGNKKTVVCMSPISPIEYSQCSMDPNSVAEMIGEENQDLYAHLFPTTVPSTTTTTTSTVSESTTKSKIDILEMEIFGIDLLETTNQSETSEQLERIQRSNKLILDDY